MREFAFKAKITAPYFTDCPPEIGEKWLSGSKKAAPKTYQGIKKAIKTRKDFQEKIAKPAAKGIASFIRPEFISESGRTHSNIMDKARDNLSRAGKHYLRRVTDAYQPGRYEQKLIDAQKEYNRQWCEIIGPLRGYKKGGIKGLAALGVMALCGDARIKDFLKERADTVDGTLNPALAGTGFRRILTNRIVRWGSQIIELGYDQQDIKPANEKLNQLVNEYRCPEVVAFNPGGPSHIDFIVVETSDPTRPGQKIKQLGLDIQINLEG